MGTHLLGFKQLLELLKKKKISDIVVFGGGTIPPKDIKLLKEWGVDRIFGPGTPLTVIVDYVKNF